MLGEFNPNLGISEERAIVLEVLDSFEKEKGGLSSMTDDEKQAYLELLESQMIPEELNKHLKEQ